MLEKARVQEMKVEGRRFEAPRTGDPDLGPLQLLPGTWQNGNVLPGRGWNAIALPFATGPASPFNFRLLVNQYNETLRFSLVDKAVPNRGLSADPVPTNLDQLLVAIDYEQLISQIVADDFPVSGKAGGPNLAIHHEPGLWLHLLNEADNGLDIARLASVPHGDSVLAMGRSAAPVAGPPVIPEISALPIGVPPDLDSPYLAPYKHFHLNPFQGIFDPTRANDLLAAANTGVNIVRTTQLTVDTTLPTGGISNIPFVVRQANAASMKSTFWIQELAELDIHGNPKLRLQYSQVVMLDFFPRRDGMPGRISWPHISINTLEKVIDPVPGTPDAVEAEPRILALHEVAKAAR